MKHTVRILLSTSVLCISAAAHAGDGFDRAPGGFSSEIKGSETLSYDSNPLRVVSGEKSLFGSTTTPELVLRYKTPLTEVEADTTVEANYFNRSQFNSVDLHEKLMLKRQNERWTTSLRGIFDYDTTRTSEITNYGINIPKVRSTHVGATPQVTFRPNPRDALSLSANIEDTSYDNNAYTDYTIYSISPSYEHSFDQYNKGRIAMRAQRYETNSGTSQRSDSIGPTLGWTTILTEKLTAHAEAGAQSIEKSGANTSGSDGWNYVFSTSLNYRGQQDTLSLRATRALEPFGNGTETLLTSFGITERHAINPKLSLNGEARYQIADYSSPPGVNLDHGVTAGGGLTYKIVDNVDLDASYKYRSEDLTNTSGSIDQHIVMLGVTVHPTWSGK